MRRKLLFIGLFLFVCLASFGQKKRFREMSKDDFYLEADWADTSFAALILLDRGIIDFDLSAEEGFFYTLERRQRIRIENENRYEWADIRIPLIAFRKEP